jgi:hypothetical protein
LFIESSTHTKRELAKKCKISIQQVEDWIFNRRKICKKKTCKRYTKFSRKQIKIMESFFNSIDKKREFYNFKELSETIGEPEKKIKQWLRWQRYKKNKNL